MMRRSTLSVCCWRHRALVETGLRTNKLQAVAVGVFRREDALLAPSVRRRAISRRQACSNIHRALVAAGERGFGFFSKEMTDKALRASMK